MTDTWMERYLEIINKNYNIPSIFVKASSYHLVSNLLGRFVGLDWIPTQTHQPNLMFLLSGHPGTSRRSTIQGIDNGIWTRTLKAYYEDVSVDTLYFKKTDDNKDEKDDKKDKKAKKPIAFKDLSKWEKNKFISDLSIESGTGEGVSDHLTYMTKKYPEVKSYDITGTEFGLDLKRMAGTGYEVSLSGIISKLYCGEPYSQHLSKRKGSKPRFFPSGLFITMLCGMQDPSVYIAPSMIKQGLFRRLILIHVPKNDRYLPLIARRDNVSNELTSLIKEMKDMMIKYKGICDKLPFMDDNYGTPYHYIDCHLQNPVMEKINKWDEQLFRSANENHNNLNSVKQSLAEATTKLAILESIQDENNLKEPSKGTYYFSIREDHYENANNFMQEIIANWSNIFSKLGATDNPLKDSTEALRTIKQYIADAGEDGIKRSKLLHSSGILKGELDIHIRTLIERRDIIEEMKSPDIGKPVIGRVPTIYKIRGN